MTRVDFYILEQPGEHARLTAACRLADKAFRLELRIYVHVPDDATAQRLDETLWTFRAGSFLPHAPIGQLNGYPASLPAPVLIGSADEPPADHWDLLVNLAPEVPLFFSRYKRVAELVGGDPEPRQQGRRRYRFYRDRGYELHTHRLQSALPEQ